MSAINWFISTIVNGKEATRKMEKEWRCQTTAIEYRSVAKFSN